MKGNSDSLFGLFACDRQVSRLDGGRGMLVLRCRPAARSLASMAILFGMALGAEEGRMWEVARSSAEATTVTSANVDKNSPSPRRMPGCWANGRGRTCQMSKPPAPTDGHG